MSPRLKSALVLAGVFALGAVTGGSAVHFTHARRIHAMLDGSPHQARLRMALRAIDDEVHLDSAQRAKVQEIFAAHESEMKEIRRSTAPRLGALRNKIADEIRAVLRPDQVEAFNALHKRQESKARATLDEPPDGN